MEKTNSIFYAKWLILIWLISLPIPAFTQQKNISLKVNNTRIEDVFNLIGQQTGYKFSYASTCIDKNRKISLTVNNKLINSVLPLILGKQVRYKISGNYVILLPSVSETKKDEAKKVIDKTETQPSFKDKKTLTKTTDKEQISSLNTFFLKKIAVPNTGISIDDCHRDIISKNEKKMRTKIATFILATTLSATTISAQTTNDSVSLPNKFAQATFIYPIGTNGIQSTKNAYNLSLNILGGFTGDIKGFEMGGIFNLNNYGVSGVQMAGVFNASGLGKKIETNKGVQMAGIFNAVNGNMPVQIAGCYNGTLSNNIYQASGVVNTAKTSKAQMAGVVNVAKNSVVQMAGVANIAKKSPVQIATLNVADTTTTQIGVINVSRRNKFQMGVVNIRDTADGFSLGIFNFVLHGGVKELELAVGDYVQGSASLRFGTNQLYSILSFGSNFDKKYYSTGFGLGTKAILSKHFDIDLEAIHYNFYASFLEMSGYNSLVQFRPILDFSYAKHFSLFAGPTFNLSLSDKVGEVVNPPYVIYNVIDKPTFQSDFWIGFTAGLRYKF